MLTPLELIERLTAPGRLADGRMPAAALDGREISPTCADGGRRMSYAQYKLLVDLPARTTALGFGYYAQALKESIESSAPQFAVGIFGTWVNGEAVNTGLSQVRSLAGILGQLEGLPQVQAARQRLDAIEAALSDAAPLLSKADEASRTGASEHMARARTRAEELQRSLRDLRRRGTIG
jgi:hypothetical protein